ncbi:MAG: substrate-binding domain-containing protein [Planctomycetota bacterium]
MTNAHKVVSNGPANQSDVASMLREHIAGLCAGKPARSNVRLPAERELAELFGISRAAVRHALHRLETEGLITRQKGRGTFARVGPRPLTTSTSDSTVVLCLPSSTYRQFRYLRDGFQETMEAAGYSVLVSYDYGEPEAQAESILRAMTRGLTAACISGLKTPVGNHHVLPLQRLGIPVSLCCLKTDAEVRAPRVAVDKKSAGRVMGRHLRELGHTRLVAVLSIEAEADHVVLEGLRNAYEAHGQPLERLRVISPESFRLDSWSYDGGDFRQRMASSFTELMDSDEPPTAVVAMTDILTEEIYFALSSMGLRVPADISLMGYGVRPRDEGISRCLTAVVYDAAERGRVAAEYLLRMLRQDMPIQATDVTLLETLIHRGETVRDITGSHSTTRTLASDAAASKRASAIDQ